MKNTLLILAFITLTTSLFAQRNERVKALKIAFITERLELTSNEAQKFWPIYNTIEDEKEALRKDTQKLRRGLNFEELNDDEANTLVQRMLDLEDNKHALQKKQVTNLLKVIPAKKVILLKVTEDQFNKRMLEEIKKRRGKLRGNKP